MIGCMFLRLPRCDVAANQLLRTRLTFSKSLMLSVAASKMGCSGVVFVAATCCNDCCQRSASSVFKSMRFVDFFYAFLCTFACVSVINRNAFYGQLMRFRRTAVPNSPADDNGWSGYRLQIATIRGIH